MILQALCDYYDALARRGEVTPPGWSVAKVSFALDIDEQGILHGVIPLKEMPAGGKKEVPQPMQVPKREERTSGVCSNFLCENSSYFLGIDSKGKPERSRQCFDAAKELHQKILGPVDSPAARAVCAFFDAWAPEQASEHPVLLPYLKEILKGANLIFWVKDSYTQDDPAVRAAWQDHCAARSAEAVFGRCLVTGRQAPIAQLHPRINGVQGAQSSGAPLVSFNAPAFESYGHQKADGTGQGLNSPVSEDAAFRYGAALNRLIADREHLRYIGDTAVVYWAEDAEPMYQVVFCCGTLDGKSEIITDGDLQDAVEKLAHGRPVDVNGVPLRPDNRFYVLGLAPNAGRLSVRFFLRNTFGELLNNIQKHYDRLEIIRPEYEKAPGSLWRLVFETQRTSKEVSDGQVKGSGKLDKELEKLAADLLYSILTDRPYPTSWLSKVLARIHREQNITSARAAILKAYVQKNSKNFRCKEVASVSLKAESDYFPYVWGRIFSVFEDIQLQYTRIDNPGARPNATIKSRFFNAASTTPEHVFPTLERLKNSHMDKLEKQRPAIYLSFSKQLAELFSKVEFPFPNHLNNEEQVAFFLGYYHQTQKRYEKKEENENV